MGRKSRRHWEFPKWIKESLGGGRGSGKEVHHKAPIWACKELGVHPYMASGKANAEVLTPEEHKERHRTRTREDDLEEARKLLVLQPRLPHVDDDDETYGY